MAQGLIVEVRSEDVSVKEGNSQRTGKPYRIVEQTGWAHLPGQPYPQRCVFTVPDGEDPYKTGIYPVSPESYFVGRFDQLMFRPRLARNERRDLPNSVKAVSNG